MNMHNIIGLLRTLEMSVPSPSKIKRQTPEFSRILPVQDKMSNFGDGFQILLSGQLSLSVKISYADPCFSTDFIVKYLGIMTIIF